MTETEYQHPMMVAYWAQLDTRFKPVEEVFEDLMAEALAILTREDIYHYLDAARVIGKLGRGVEPMLAFMEEWPSVVKALGEEAVLSEVMAFVMRMQKSPNGKAITPFLQTIAPVARKQHSREQMRHYIEIADDLMARTTGSIHGHHTTFPSPGLPEFFKQAPFLFGMLSMGGVRNWVEYGIRNYRSHPERQIDYFSLQSADARAVLQRERHGTLFSDVERKLDLYLRGLWQEADQLVPYSTAFDELRKPIPYYDKLGMRVPDVFDDFLPSPPGGGWRAAPGEGTTLAGAYRVPSPPAPPPEGEGRVSGIDRYRAVLAHMVGHRRWSSSVVADNYSPFQRMAVEFFEDCRIENLLIREYPGLRRIFLALHPKPVEGACDPETTSCLRHRLTMLSRALIDPEHGYTDPHLLDFVQRFHGLLADGESSLREIADLALSYVARTRRQSDQFAKVWFDGTVIDYRDDNRHLWQYIEDSDDEEFFDDPDKSSKKPAETMSLPPRHYPEWDYHSQTYRPDWVSLYENLHPKGNAGDIERILQKHDALAKRLKRILDLLKPQDKIRIRYQEEGSELDLDVAIRSLIDFKGGANPDPRINMSHKTNGRNIAVHLLLDLSESLNEKVAGSEQTILELSQEAVTLLAWSVEKLGDPFAISGFHSNTRHDVRYLHIKGYSEGFSDEVKARMAAMQAGWSTRMGAAMRHAAHYLEARPADKKLLLILTDGQPADVDAHDERLLIEDARRAVRELDQKGIFTYCINLDSRLKPGADNYVSDIFGHQYTVIDNIQRLPERLPELFMALTK